VVVAACGGSANDATHTDHSTSSALTLPASTATDATGLAGTDEGPAIVETTPETPSRFAGGEVSPVVAAPQLGLRRWDGKRTRIGDYNGKVVLVTFIYASCPDICPAITDKLIKVKRRLGKDGKNLAIVAVSVDPDRDTPATVQSFLRGHQALGKMDYLIGSQEELQTVWENWGVAARVSPSDPKLIDHSGVIWGVDPKGRRVTFYPATGFGVEEIASDVRVMLGR
jgi:protein SCO1/2